MITASGSVGRIICPLIAGLLATELKYGQNSAYLFCVLLAVLSWLLTMVGIGKPAHEQLQEEKEGHESHHLAAKHSKSYDALSSTKPLQSNTSN